MLSLAREVPVYTFRSETWTARASELPGVRVWDNGELQAPHHAAWLVHSWSKADGYTPAIKWKRSIPAEKPYADVEATLAQRGEVTANALSIVLPFQREGIAFAASRRGALLVWPGGAGKTLGCMLTALAVPDVLPIVVVTKAAVRGQWASDGFRRFTSINPFVLEPAPLRKKRKKETAEAYAAFVDARNNRLQRYVDTRRAANQRPVIIVAWSALNDAPTKASKHPQPGEAAIRAALGGPYIVVFDEIHMGKQWKRVKSVLQDDGSRTWEPIESISTAAERLSRGAAYRYGASATPIKDRIRDYWAILDLVEPGAWGTPWAFFTRYCDARPIPGVAGAWDNKGKSNTDELRQRLAFVRHSVPYDVSHAALLHLKRRESWYINPKDVAGAGWSPERYAAELRVAAGQPGRTMEVQVAAAAASMRPAIVERIVDAIEANPRCKIVILDIRHENVDLMSADLRNALAGVDVWSAHGGITTPAAREVIRTKYMAHPGPCVLDATGDCFGTGVSLHDTDILIIAAPPWTPGDLHQWEQRVSRLGQKRAALIVYAVLKGSVIEAIASKVISKLPAVEAVEDDRLIGDAYAALSGTDDADAIAANLLAVFSALGDDDGDDD